MSEPTSTFEEPRAWLDDPWNRFRVRFGATLSILVLNAVGIGLVDVRSSHACGYWTVVVVITGAICMALAAISHRGQGIMMGMVVRQGLHWLSLVLAFWLLSYYYRTNYVGAEATGDVAALLLTLTTWLAGIHFDPFLLAVAALLALIAYLDTFLERYLVFLVLVLLAVVALVVVFRRGRAYFAN